MSLGKTADGENVSVFKREDVKICKEEDILITYNGELLLIGKQDERVRYRIPLVQQRGQWRPKNLPRPERNI